MGEFEFRVAGEVIGQWDGNGPADWILPDGELFFVCSWRFGQQKLTWFGIYHEALDYIEAFARRSGRRVRQLIRSPHEWYRLEELSTETPGWGLVYEPAPGALKIFRDPIGRLPLVWKRATDSIEWATVARALPSFERKFCTGTLRRDINRNLGGSNRDYWAGVRRIRAGEVLTVSRRVDKTYPLRVDSQWWWPKPVNIRETPLGKNVAQRVGDALQTSLNEGIERVGAAPISLSAGVDSSLLLALAAGEGQAPIGFSMVDPTAPGFDESEQVRQLHDHLGTQGRYYDIGGPQRWSDWTILSKHSLFGPAAFPEIFYIIPFLNFVRTTLEKLNLPPVIFAGIGADQIFSCRKSVFYQALLAKSSVPRRLSAVSHLSKRHLAKNILAATGLSSWVIIPKKGRNNLNRASKSSGYYFSRPRYFSIESWKLTRSRQFRNWRWERSARLFERYRRQTGMLYWLPFLQPKICRLAFCLSPDQLRSASFAKIPLRRLLEGRVPNNIAKRKKSGLFTEVVQKGLAEYASHEDIRQYASRGNSLAANPLVDLSSDRTVSDWVSQVPMKSWPLISMGAWICHQANFQTPPFASWVE